MISKRAALAALAAIIVSAPSHASVTIASAATQNMNCSDGICVPTAIKAVLNVSDLESYLSRFGDVRVMTTGNGVEANNIVVRSAFSSPDSTSLTLDAHEAITINAAVSIGSGTAELEVQSDAGGQTGTLLFGPRGHITFGALSDIFGINGAVFTLLGSVQGLAKAVAANPKGFYALANDYDASGDGSYSGSPVAKTLSGQVQGLGNTISRLSIKYTRDAEPVGLFKQVGIKGAVENLRLEKIKFGDSYRDGVIGGLAGDSEGYLSGDKVEGSIDVADGEAGGLAWRNDTTGTIVSSSADVRLTTGTKGGGLADENDGTISLSHAHSLIVGMGGGLVALNTGTVSQSYATASATGEAGGLVYVSYGPISDSYAAGALTGYGSGGLLQYNAGAYVTSSYSTSAVTYESGGFVCVRNQEDYYSDDFWDITTSGTTNGTCEAGTANIVGLTSKQLKSGLPTGFDPKIWAENSHVNHGFPYLIANPPAK